MSANAVTELVENANEKIAELDRKIMELGYHLFELDSAAASVKQLLGAAKADEDWEGVSWYEGKLYTLRIERRSLRRDRDALRATREDWLEWLDEATD